MRNKIIVPHWIENDTLASLLALGEVEVNDSTEPLSLEALKEVCADATALMAFMTEQVDRPLLEACPHLQVVAGALKGFDNIDVAACTDHRVLVTIVPDLLTEPTAELTLGLMIALTRNMRDGDAHMRTGAYAGWRARFYGGTLQGAVVGVIGAGAVGRETLRLLSGFRGSRLYHDVTPLDLTTEKALSARRATLEEILATSDFVVLAVPLTPTTLGMVDAGFLSRMKPGACLINPARGSLVDEAAIAAALEAGHLGGYAADTYEMEDWARPDRPRRVHPGLLASEKTVLTPHIGSAVVEVRRGIAASAADSIVAALKGELPETALNPEVMKG